MGSHHVAKHGASSGKSTLPREADGHAREQGPPLAAAASGQAPNWSPGSLLCSGSSGLPWGQGGKAPSFQMAGGARVSEPAAQGPAEGTATDPAKREDKGGSLI